MPSSSDSLPGVVASLAQLAYKAEHAASRRLAAQAGCSVEEALRRTLEQAAGGPARMHDMLARRQASADAHRRAALLRAQRSEGASAGGGESGDGAPRWTGWFDGSAWPNPGRCAIGALLAGPAGERIAISRSAGWGDSSEAEYRALIALLEAALAAGAAALAVRGDSKVVIDDVQAQDGAHARVLAPLREQARALLAQLPGSSLRWIPRHRNGEADALSQQARRGDSADLPTAAAEKAHSDA